MRNNCTAVGRYNRSIYIQFKNKIFNFSSPFFLLIIIIKLFFFERTSYAHNSSGLLVHLLLFHQFGRMHGSQRVKAEVAQYGPNDKDKEGGPEMVRLISVKEKEENHRYPREQQRHRVSTSGWRPSSPF